MNEKHSEKLEIEITNYVDHEQVKREVAVVAAASGCPICLTCSCSSGLMSIGGFFPGGGGNNSASTSVLG